MAMQVVTPQGPSLIQENAVLQVRNARLEVQIEGLIKERDQAKRSSERLKVKLDDAREKERLSRRKLSDIEDYKPSALWRDVLLPMVRCYPVDSDASVF
jgi:hypothetical protein